MKMHPIEVDDVTMAFGGNVASLMPTWAEIPAAFKEWCRPGTTPGTTNWQLLVSDWFYSGVKFLTLVPKEGIDKNTALRHVGTIMRSFEPKHEHKEAACAYLLSEWFESATWERAKK